VLWRDVVQLNNLKSRAVVKFATVDQAVKARDGLWHSDWGQSKAIELDFIDGGDADHALSGSISVQAEPAEVKDNGDKMEVDSEPPEQRDLSSLFSKTEAQPSIYYKPLTDEEVRAKQVHSAPLLQFMPDAKK